MPTTVEESLYYAAQGGHASLVSALLRDHADLNVSWADSRQRTALHVASYNGHVEVVKLLLAHPTIEVNLKDSFESTTFFLACLRGYLPVVQWLLKDARVNTTLADQDSCSPLWVASWQGHYEVVEWLIASGSDLGDLNSKGKWKGCELCSALEIATRKGHTDVVSLLERLTANPTRTFHEVRVKLGVLGELAAEVFALTIFLCDDLLQLKPALNPAVTPNSASAVATRFFAIATRLPLELQMILCYRVVGSAKQNILSDESEVAFKSLARELLLLRDPFLSKSE